MMSVQNAPAPLAYVSIDSVVKDEPLDINDAEHNPFASDTGNAEVQPPPTAVPDPPSAANESRRQIDMDILVTVVAKLELMTEKLAAAAFIDQYDQFGKYLVSLLRKIPHRKQHWIKLKLLGEINMALDSNEHQPSNPYPFMLDYQNLTSPIVVEGHTPMQPPPQINVPVSQGYTVNKANPPPRVRSNERRKRLISNNKASKSVNVTTVSDEDNSVSATELNEPPSKLPSNLSRKKEETMAVATHVIVKFINEESSPVEVVPICWIYHDKECVYPENSSNIVNMVKKSAQPSDLWPRWPIKVLRKYNSYEAARKQLPQAEDTSNLESESEERYGKRKRYSSNLLKYPNEPLSPSSEDKGGEERTSSFPQLSSFIAQNEVLTLINDTSVLNDTVVIEVPSHCTLPNTAFIPSSKSSLPHPTTPFSPVPLPSTSTSSSSQEVTNETLFQILLTMQSSLEDIYEQLKTKNQPNNDQTDEFMEFCMINIPIRDENMLAEFEERLFDSKMRKKLVRFMSTIGGSSLKHHLFNIMRRIFADTLLISYSYTGKKGFADSKTTSFEKLRICGAIQDALKKSFEKATEDSMKKYMMSYLNQAKTRVIRRKKDDLEDASAEENE